MIEPLETRQHYAAYAVDPAYGSAGAASVSFKTTTADSAVRDVQIVATSGDETYVLARFKNSVQVRRLTAQGQIDTGWAARNDLLVFPTADENVSTKIVVDAADRLLVLVGQSIYRFAESGVIDSSFGGTGVVALSDFTGNVDIDVDANSRVVVTGSTSRGAGMLVERFITRGKLDRTFNLSGKVVAPLPRSMRTLPTPAGQGLLVRVLADGDIMVAGQIDAGGYSPGVAATRIDADGDIDTAYGRGGTAALLGPPTSETSRNSVRAVGILPSGAVSMYGLSVPLLDNGSPIDRYPALFTQAGSLVESPRTIDKTTAGPDGAFLGITDGIVFVYSDDLTLNLKFNDGVLISGVRDADLLDDNSLLISNVSAKKAGRVTVAKIQPVVFD